MFFFGLKAGASTVVLRSRTRFALIGDLPGDKANRRSFGSRLNYSLRQKPAQRFAESSLRMTEIFDWMPWMRQIRSAPARNIVSKRGVMVSGDAHAEYASESKDLRLKRFRGN